MRVAVYARISRDPEGRELGVERQLQDCQEYAERRGWTVVGTFVDNDRSASTLSTKPRPRYQRMLDECRAGRVDAILAYTSARLTRQPIELEEQIKLAQEHGTRFEHLRSPSFDLNTAAGRRVARSLMAHEAGQPEDASELGKREALQRAEQGRAAGGPRAYGWGIEVGRKPIFDKITRKPETDPDTGEPKTKPIFDMMRQRPDEAEVITGWYADIIAGRSLRAMERDALARGLVTAQGHPFKHWAIRDVLLNPRHKGKRLLHGNEYDLPVESIVDDVTWGTVHEILTDPERRSNDTNARKWIGVGLFRCSLCGNPVRTRIPAAGYRTYKCRENCQRSWNAAAVDAYVIELIAERLRRDDAVNLLVTRVDGPDLATLYQELKGYLMKKGQLARLLLDGVFTEADVRKSAAELDTNIHHVREKIAEASNTNALGAVLAAPNPAEEWLAIAAGDDVQPAQEVITALVTVSLKPSGRGHRNLDWSKYIQIDWMKAN